MHVLCSLRHRGYDAEGVEDGTQTLARLERGRFDAVVTDVQMPGMDGLGLLRENRRLGHRVPVAVHSSSVDAAAEALFRRAVAFRMLRRGVPSETWCDQWRRPAGTMGVPRPGGPARRGRDRKEVCHMRYGYWFDAIMGVILILVPFVGKFQQDPPALYVDLAVGLALVAWAAVRSITFGGQDVQGGHPTRA